MNRYISAIQINNLYHLKDLTIQIADEDSPHLILTGKNGSGKTVLLNAIIDFLDRIKRDTSLGFLNYPQYLAAAQAEIKQFEEGSEKYPGVLGNLRQWQSMYDAYFGKINIEFADNYGFIKDYNEGNFIIAFYQAARKTTIHEPKNPTKPELWGGDDGRRNLTSELLNFLSDLKIQEALARNENLTEDADRIKEWFDNFEKIISRFFEDPELKIKFNYKDYSFTIHTQGKAFKLTELSDGFIAILDIVADLILKMQPKGSLSMEFNKPGIVLIDEIETHLHLKLQKLILPMLTTLFPNIQFIVSSHSPFVLSSLPNATAYDLEHNEPITNLSEYSHRAITDCYFDL